MKVLVLTVSEEPNALLKPLGVGALGYVPKTARLREIVDALLQVYFKDDTGNCREQNLTATAFHQINIVAPSLNHF